jgi:hypothetical protein
MSLTSTSGTHHTGSPGGLVPGSLLVVLAAPEFVLQSISSLVFDMYCLSRVHREFLPAYQ